MPPFPNCETSTQHPTIVLEENRRKMVFDNPSRQNVRRIRVDGCVINNGVRCDYLVVSQNGREHFVELKGADIRHAITQLERTISLISAAPTETHKYAFVVSSTCPLLTTEIQNLKKRFLRDFKAVLVLKNNICTHTIE